jgi:plastocyanin
MRVELDEFSFAPPEVTVERGATVEAAKVASTAHNLTVERGGGRDEAGEELVASETFAGGERRTVEIDVAPGRYTLVCTVPGHREAGMVGTITVR